jgi:hypothetical protein
VLYVTEGDNEEPLETRFLKDVKLEEVEAGALRLSKSERTCVRLAYTQHTASRANNGPQRREDVNVNECTLCAKYHGDEDVQVLCDRCDLDWHLECLNQSGIEVPDDVFHLEVVWYCLECKDEQEGEIASAVAYESDALHSIPQDVL